MVPHELKKIAATKLKMIAFFIDLIFFGCLMTQM